MKSVAHIVLEKCQITVIFVLLSLTKRAKFYGVYIFIYIHHIANSRSQSNKIYTLRCILITSTLNLIPL